MAVTGKDVQKLRDETGVSMAEAHAILKEEEREVEIKRIKTNVKQMIKDSRYRSGINTLKLIEDIVDLL